MPVYSLLKWVVCLQSVAPGVDAVLEVRGLFEKGDYPGAERAIVALLESNPGARPEERALLYSKLAEARIFQGISPGAVEAIEQATRLSRSRPVRRSAVMVYLRSQHYRELLEPSGSLLEELPTDPALRFAHGVALSKMGKHELAIDDLRAATESPEWRRDARFELGLALSKLGRIRDALVPFREILEANPHDGEACYQTARQLLRLKKPEPSRLAALLTRYFEALRQAEGESSRAEHLSFAGKPLEAGLERAARLERVGAVEAAIAEASRLRSLPGGEAPTAAWLEGLDRRLGIPALATIADLQALLAEAPRARDSTRASGIAKAILARDPKSRPALQCLLDSTSDPSLAVPRLHYLSRLSEVDPADAPVRTALSTLRASFEGLAPAR